jgi:hypothetical protein
MGHERSRRGDLEGGSRIGARYRHTTPEMAVRVAAAIQERLVVVVQVAERCSSGTAPAAECSSRYQQVTRSCYSVRAKRATARPSRTRQVAATIAICTGTGTCQPPQVMPGSKVARAAGLRSRWSNTVERIGSTA